MAGALQGARAHGRRFFGGNGRAPAAPGTTACFASLSFQWAALFLGRGQPGLLPKIDVHSRAAGCHSLLRKLIVPVSPRWTFCRDTPAPVSRANGAGRADPLSTACFASLSFLTPYAKQPALPPPSPVQNPAEAELAAATPHHSQAAAAGLSPGSGPAPPSSAWAEWRRPGCRGMGGASSVSPAWSAGSVWLCRAVPGAASALIARVFLLRSS